MRVLVTGASGFVGSALCAHLVGKGMSVVGSVRQLPSRSVAAVDYKIVAGLSADTDWQAALEGADAVFHCAARVHVMGDNARGGGSEYIDTNVAATTRLAEQAARFGVRRFVFVSSIKVNGERTEAGRRFSERDAANPHDAYARSKLEAERALFELSNRSALEVVVVRPPLIYGPHVRANFLQLLRIIDRAIPLPLLAVQNSRSLLYIGNFASAIEYCLTKEAAAEQTFLVRDGEDFSTPRLIRQLAHTMDRPVRLFRAPLPVLRGAAVLLGRSEALGRLTDSLQIDDGKIRAVLDWRPPFTPADGFCHTVEWYRDAFSRSPAS